MRISIIANKIIRKNLALICSLKKEGRMDVNIVALILCELYFSSNSKRLIEYIVWIFLSLLNSPKRYYISVGIGQIQIRHWVTYNFINQKDIIKSLSQFMNVKSNYDLAKKIIDQYDPKRLNDSRILAMYRGETRAYHFNLFIALKEELLNPAIVFCVTKSA